MFKFAYSNTDIDFCFGKPCKAISVCWYPQVEILIEIKTQVE